MEGDPAAICSNSELHGLLRGAAGADRLLSAICLVLRVFGVRGGLSVFLSGGRGQLAVVFLRVPVVPVGHVVPQRSMYLDVKTVNFVVSGYATQWYYLHGKESYLVSARLLLEYHWGSVLGGSIMLSLFYFTDFFLAFFNVPAS